MGPDTRAWSEDQRSGGSSLSHYHDSCFRLQLLACAIQLWSKNTDQYSRWLLETTPPTPDKRVPPALPRVSRKFHFHAPHSPTLPFIAERRRLSYLAQQSPTCASLSTVDQGLTIQSTRAGRGGSVHPKEGAGAIAEGSGEAQGRPGRGCESSSRYHVTPISM